MSFTFTNLSKSYYEKTPRSGDIHSTTGQTILSQLLRWCLLLATVMTTNGGWHRSRGCWLLGEWRLLRGFWLWRGCWILLDAANVWLLFLQNFCWVSSKSRPSIFLQRREDISKFLENQDRGSFLVKPYFGRVTLENREFLIFGNLPHD